MPIFVRATFRVSKKNISILMRNSFSHICLKILICFYGLFSRSSMNNWNSKYFSSSTIFGGTCGGREIINLKKVNSCQAQISWNIFWYFDSYNTINEKNGSVSLGVVFYIGIFWVRTPPDALSNLGPNFNTIFITIFGLILSNGEINISWERLYRHNWS